MEYSKYEAFMIQCNRCSTRRSLTNDDVKKQNITCDNLKCGSEFSIYEGVKNGLKNYEHYLAVNSFLAQNISYETIDIKIGYTKDVSFPENTKKVYQVEVHPISSFKAGVVNLTNKGFTIFTSLSEDNDLNRVGQTSKVAVMLNAKTDDFESSWLHMLQYALDQLLSDEYLTSILLSEIAFENYVDSMLNMGYLEIGLDQDSINRILVATNLPTKVNPLMNNIFGVKLSDSSSWRNWEKKTLKWRNEIAHGTKKTATKEEAKLVYESVVDSMFHFIEGVDNHMKKVGKPSVFLYR